MYSRDSTLLTMHGIEDRRVLVCVSEEKGYWEHFKDGGGVSTMSVSSKLEISQQGDITTDRASFYVYDLLARENG